MKIVTKRNIGFVLFLFIISIVAEGCYSKKMIRKSGLNLLAIDSIVIEEFDYTELTKCITITDKKTINEIYCILSKTKPYGGKMFVVIRLRFMCGDQEYKLLVSDGRVRFYDTLP